MGGNTFLDQILLSNPIGRWLLAVAFLLSLAVVLRSLSAYVIRRLESLTDKTRTDLDDLIIELLKKTRGLFVVLLSVWASSLVLALEAPHQDFLFRVLWIGLLFQGGLWATGLVNYFLRRYRRQQEAEDPGMATALGAVGFLAKAALWAVFTLLILQNLGVQITPLLAGVSVGGIAVALAVQNVLGDLLSSLSIILDKPFVIGDYIVVGDFSGTVEHVGLKSTHIRSVSGEQLVFSNSDLLSSRIRNYKRMQERRAVFSLGVTYSTPAETLEAIPGMIREIVEAQEHTRFGRSHFKSFGGYSLDVETVFFMTIPDYETYMDVQQAINLAIYRRFGEEGIEFAFPTQTLHVEGDGSEPEGLKNS